MPILLILLAMGHATADEDALCNIGTVEVSPIDERRKVGAEGCMAAYYTLCEELVEKGQETCNNICQRFRKRGSLQPFALQECTAERIETSIDAFDPVRHCRTEAKDRIVRCTMDYECSCEP